MLLVQESKDDLDALLCASTETRVSIVFIINEVHDNLTGSIFKNFKTLIQSSKRQNATIVYFFVPNGI